LRGDEFPSLLQHEFFHEKKRVSAARAVKAAVETLCAIAIYGTNEQHEVYLRVAGFGGKIYIDLGDEKYQAIEFDAEGWRIVDRPPVRFRRPPTMRPLPRPQAGGSINQLRKFINLSDDGFILFVAVLLFAFIPGRPHPVLYLAGEEGTQHGFESRSSADRSGCRADAPNDGIRPRAVRGGTPCASTLPKQHQQDHARYQ
jgi:hypothetical protein